MKVLIDYFSTLESRRAVSNVEPGYLRPLLPSAPPEEGEKWEDVQKDIEAKIMPGLTHWQSSNFMAFFPANATYPSLLGELYSAAFTAPAFNWLCSPACTELETIVLDYLCNLLRLPSSYLSTSPTGGGGVIQGSASEAIVTVMIAARERYIRQRAKRPNGEENQSMTSKEEEEEEEDEWRLRSRLVALGSEMSHSSTQKAAMIAGVKYRNIPVSAADDFALTGRGLEDALEDLRRENLEPFYLTVTLGTTSTCAVDQFKEIAEVKKDFPSLWIHVDAAYAGAALILEDYQELTEGFEMFDSFDVNMHKWLLTNFDARYVDIGCRKRGSSPIAKNTFIFGCVFLPRREPLISALSITPSYLQNNYSTSGLVTDYRDWQIPLGRRFRALKIWFVLRMYGINGLKRHVRRHIVLGEKFAGWVRYEGRNLFKIVAKPRFALTVLRVRVPDETWDESAEVVGKRGMGRPEMKINEGVAEDDVQPITVNGDAHGSKDRGVNRLTKANALTKEVYERINAGGKIFLTSTMIKDTYAIRVVGANEQTDEAHLRKAFDILSSTAKDVLVEREKQAQ
ncbi:MAG: hypothetical protein Q9201_007364 [Fulgogasparrea decipioides]